MATLAVCWVDGWGEWGGWSVVTQNYHREQSMTDSRTDATYSVRKISMLYLPRRYPSSACSTHGTYITTHQYSSSVYNSHAIVVVVAIIIIIIIIIHSHTTRYNNSTVTEQCQEHVRREHGMTMRTINHNKHKDTKTSNCLTHCLTDAKASIHWMEKSITASNNSKTS